MYGRISIVTVSRISTRMTASDGKPARVKAKAVSCLGYARNFKSQQSDFQICHLTRARILSDITVPLWPANCRAGREGTEGSPWAFEVMADTIEEDGASEHC